MENKELMETDNDAEIYPCADCGKLISKNQGGTIFTICEKCWDKKYKKKETSKTEAPKELMDCILPPEELRDLIWDKESGVAKSYSDIADAISKAQLNSDKLKAYIQEQKKEVIKALADYNMGRISGERCAEIIGMNTYEFFELLRKIDNQEVGNYESGSMPSV